MTKQPESDNSLRQRLQERCSPRNFGSLDTDVVLACIYGIGSELDEAAEKMGVKRRGVDGAVTSIDLTRDDIDRLRQWYVSLRDTNSAYLERADSDLAQRLHDLLGMRMSSRDKIGSGP